MCSSTLPSPPQDIAATADKSATAPSKPSCHLHVSPQANDPLLSPDPSPLLQRKVMQSGAAPSGDVLIPITHGGDGEEDREGAEGGISSWTPVSPSYHSDVFSGTTAHENVSDFREPRQNPKRSSVMSTSSVASRTSDVAGSVESHDSVFGSCKSNSSLKSTKTRSRNGSLKKPLPPPKPKSLERGKARAPSTSSQSDGQTVKRKEETAMDDGSGSRDDAPKGTPPPKPPRPMRGSVKLNKVVGVEDGERGREGGEGNAAPPPKPARRNRSLKMTASEQQQLQQQQTPERKTHTMQPQTTSRDSWSTNRTGQSSGDNVTSVVATSAAPRKPAAKPRVASSGPRAQAKQIAQSSPSSLKEKIAAKLSEEDISLSEAAYSTLVRI